MSCTPTPTATLYATVSTFTPSTSYSQSVSDTQPQVTTVVQQSCVASGTISGSLLGCISSAQVTEVNTLAGGDQVVQVPIVVSIPVAETQPTQTLFAPCTNEGGSSSTSQTAAQPSINTPLTTSVLVQSTPPPSTVVEASSTTLADGSVVQTVVTVVITPLPTGVYVPTSLANPTLQSSVSPGSGTDVAPIVGGVLGGFLGLVAIVGSLWWLCRRRRSWDDIFEKEEFQNGEAQVPVVPVRRERDSRRLDLSAGAEPKPYQYGLVGHVIPPGAAGEPLRTSLYGSVSEHSGAHSRHTSFSATPLLQGTHTGSSRPSTAGSILTVQTQPGPRVLSPVGSTETERRSLSMLSHSNSTRPLLDGQSTPALLGNWTPNTDDLTVLVPLNRPGSPVSPISPTERCVLQIVNDGPPSPTDTVVPGARPTFSGPSSSVIVHTDGGRIPEGSLTGMHTDPPAYSR